MYFSVYLHVTYLGIVVVFMRGMKTEAGWKIHTSTTTPCQQSALGGAMVELQAAGTENTSKSHRRYQSHQPMSIILCLGILKFFYNFVRNRKSGDVLSHNQ